MVGSRRPFQWNKPVSRRRVSLKEILEEEPVVEIPKYVAKRLKGKYRDLPIISDPDRGDIAPTCVAHYSKDLSPRLVVDRRFKHGVRPYSVREYARLQGVPDSFVFPCSERAAYKMIGNGVSIPVGRWIGRETIRYFKMN
jgi:DNA (cytosine-5)-methyltransferase 1